MILFIQFPVLPRRQASVSEKHAVKGAHIRKAGGKSDIDYFFFRSFQPCACLIDPQTMDVFGKTDAHTLNKQMREVAFADMQLLRKDR